MYKSRYDNAVADGFKIPIRAYKKDVTTTAGNQIFNNSSSGTPIANKPFERLVSFKPVGCAIYWMVDDTADTDSHYCADGERIDIKLGSDGQSWWTTDGFQFSVRSVSGTGTVYFTTYAEYS
tara:strand:- start:67 stop:432 length:366 start_codon:yes stop_codon:yes gene_type:complete